MRSLLASTCLVLLACGSERPPAGAQLARPAAEPAPTAPDDPAEEELRAFVESRVREGYQRRDDIIEDVVAIFEESGSLEATATRLVDEALARQREREATWSQPTDCDRLTRAFAALDASGIVAREKWSDCGTCGAGEISLEMERLVGEGRAIRGYAFFHDQDVEGVADPSAGGVLYLSYGAREGDEAASIAIGHEVVRVLREHGLNVEWDGSIEARIALVDLEWRRRRFTQAPPIPVPPTGG